MSRTLMASRSKAKRLFLSIAVLGLLWGAQYARTQLGAFLGEDSAAGAGTDSDSRSAESGPERSTSSVADDANEIRRLFRQETSGVMVQAPAEVVKSLPDDNEGSRHQRFIVELSNAHTILISHNIDLAPRVPLRQGDSIEFKGQFEWNERGGVVHWTHRDPGKRRAGGWIRHAGTTYK